MIKPGHFRCLSKVFYWGGRGSVWNRCVTCESNVCSEQTSENLVDKILDQLKKKSMTFEISECLGSQYYHSLMTFSLLK